MRSGGARMSRAGRRPCYLAVRNSKARRTEAEEGRRRAVSHLRSKLKMPSNLTAEAFAANVNTKFRVRAESPKPVELELTEVKVYNARENEQHGLERFSLFLHGPADLYVPQQTYTFEHPSMGEMELFIVPIGRDETGFRYEVVFNSFKEK
jgi:hypothetical protein